MVHTCNFYCDRPACIKAQRDDFRDRWEAIAVAPKPTYTPVTESELSAMMADHWYLSLLTMPELIQFARLVEEHHNIR